MIEMVAAAMAGAALGQFHYMTGGTDTDRPIATRAPYPASMVDDVNRPGFNGRMFVTRPVMGGMQGPWAVAEGEPGASYYGAFDQQDAMLFARVGHTTIGISPWERLDKDGLRHIERARTFWLRERGYTGGVRTFVNDAVIWRKPEPPAATPAGGAPHADAGETPKKPLDPSKIQPRATIQVPADMPRAKHRIRVQSVDPAVMTAEAPVRVSLPPGAPAALVARAAAFESAAAPEAVRVAARGE